MERAYTVRPLLHKPSGALPNFHLVEKYCRVRHTIASYVCDNVAGHGVRGPNP